MDEVEMIDVHVSSLIGESFLLRISASKAGEDLIEKVSERVPKKVGAHILLMHGTRVLSRHESLTDQGLKGTVDVSIVYATVDLLTAWQNLRDQSESERGVENVSLEGITEVKGMTGGALDSLDRLPSLESLTFHYLFNQTLKDVKFPKKLQRLTFTDSFNQSLEDVILPSTLQHLQFGDMFNQPLDHMAFPNLSSLVFGDAFNQSLKNVGLPVLESMTLGLSFNKVIDWPEGLQSLSLGSVFEHTLDHLPETLRELSCRRMYQESLDGVELPSQLQSLRFGHSFDLSLDGVKLPSTLQHLEFGYGFNQPLDQATFPTLKTLTFAGGFNQNLCNLPKTLRSLNLGHDFAKSFPVIRNLQRFECNGLRVAVEQEERLGCKFSRE